MLKHYIQWLKGLQSATSPFLVGDDDLSLMSNVNTSYKLGAIIKRLGYKQVGSTLQADKSILGLHNFRQNASTQKMLATCDDSTGDDTQLFRSTGGAWTEVTAAETAWAGKAGINVEMEDFIGYCFIVGWGATDGFIPFCSFKDTTTFSDSTNVDGALEAKFIKRYRDRLYLANLNDGGALPYRVAISDLPSGSTLGWTEYQADTGWLDVDYSEAITGLGSNWDRLMIFTEYSAYMYDQSTQKKVWDIGCSNHRTIKNSGAYMFWANMDGVWQSSGGRPINISGRVTDFIKYATPTSFFAEVVDEEYHLYVGDVTVNGIAYTNCSIIYNIATQSWRVHEYYDTLTTLGKFYSSGDDRLFLGCSDGEVMEMTKYQDTTPVYSDDGANISALWETKAFDLGDPSIEKNIQKIKFYADKAQGLGIKAMIIDKNTRALNKIVDLGTLKSYITSPNFKSLKGNFIKFIGTESGSLPYFSFYGMSVLFEANTKL